MTTILRVLSEADCHQIHEKSLETLKKTGIRVDSEKGRQILLQAGAVPSADGKNLCLPLSLVEACLASCPRSFVLGGRRPGWSLSINQQDCALIADGGALFTLDHGSTERRPAVFADWQLATRLTDALAEFGCYWGVVDGFFGSTPFDFVGHWSEIIKNFSKHIQESTVSTKETRLLLEILQIVFGSSKEIRALNPLSFLICPSSPLVLEENYLDAYLETIGYNIPAAVMPMPLLGTSGPGTLISNLLLTNCEVLAVICLLQAAQPGTPVIYASIPAISNPHSGRFGGGEVEHSLLGAAVTQMGRYYNLPVEASTGGSDSHVPGIQSGYERALNFILPILSCPDLLVAPGLLGGSMVFSPEQFIIDMEIIHRCQRMVRGIDTSPGEWLCETISRVGSGGHFMGQRSTRNALHSGELFISSLGFHDSYERWVELGKPDLLDQAHEKINQILASHTPLALDPAVEAELARLQAASI